MSHMIIIREYRPNDEQAIREIVRHALVSLVNDAFIATLMKEITFQLVVLTAAVMFIFIGVPITYCIAAIPIVLGAIYLVVYGSYAFRAMEIFQEKPYQCWVAEACEPFFFTESPEKFKYTVFSEKEIRDKCIDLGSLHRKVIGTVALNKHRFAENSSWLYRLAVDNRYRHKGVGRALTETSIFWSKTRGFDTIELSITEIQDAARQLFMNSGFQLRQMYHKQIIGSALTLLKYQLGLDLLPNL